MNTRTTRLKISLMLVAAVWACSFSASLFAQKSESAKGVQLLRKQSVDLMTVAESPIGKSFLQTTTALPTIESREIYVDRKQPRRAISKTQWNELADDEREDFESRTIDEHFYYFTRYGSPLAFLRPIEIAATAGLNDLHGKRIVDFGFGSIGHLRLLAAQGADVTGIEVDLWLKALYSDSEDTGTIGIAKDLDLGSHKSNGRLELLFGKFPPEIGDQVRGEVDWFVSKNTLKKGYIHPEQPVDPKKLVQLGATTNEFLSRVHQTLKTGGHFLIYNLHPAQAPKGQPYIPWADGRSPFSRKDFESTGFEVLAFDVDDSKQIHRLAKALKWDEQMDLKKDLFATYTLVKKK